MIRIKNGVDFSDLHPKIVKAAQIAEKVWTKHGDDGLTITSGRDGIHMPKSLHYEGRAIDLRIWHIDDPVTAAEDLQDELGPDYDVIAEEDHVHLEYDPA